MNIQHINMWDAAREVLRDKFIVLNAYIRREDSPKMKEVLLNH